MQFIVAYLRKALMGQFAVGLKKVWIHAFKKEKYYQSLIVCNDIEGLKKAVGMGCHILIKCPYARPTMT